MYKQIYVNGSSFTYGYGLDMPSYLKHLNEVNPLYPEWNSEESLLIKFRENNCWPGILQEKIKIPVINEATFGGSFERVIRMAFEFVIKNPTPEDTLYILEIPNAVRKDVWSNEEKKWKKCAGSPGDWEPMSDFEKDAVIKWYTAFESHFVSFRKELRTLVGFAAFLREKKCDFLILPTEQLIHIKANHYKVIVDQKSDIETICEFYYDEVSKLDKNIIKFEVEEGYNNGSLLKSNRSKYCEYSYYTTNLLVFYNDFLKQSFAHETPKMSWESGHPNLEGHKKIGEQIFNYINYFKSNPIPNLI